MKKFPDNFENLRILGRRKAEKGYTIYDCECAICGKKLTTTAVYIRRNHAYGCQECLAKAKKEKTLEEKREQHIGKVCGNLKIDDVIRREMKGKKLFYAECTCQKCGGHSTVKLSVLLNGEITGDRCSWSLDKGTDIVRNACVGGSNLLSHRQKLSKNSTTGVKGVSYLPGIKKYRAYITFQRKQYNLGCYADIKDAEKARKDAEERIYGNFLEWYKKEYPDKWEKVQESICKK